MKTAQILLRSFCGKIEKKVDFKTNHDGAAVGNELVRWFSDKVNSAAEWYDILPGCSLIDSVAEAFVDGYGFDESYVHDGFEHDCSTHSRQSNWFWCIDILDETQVQIVGFKESVNNTTFCKIVKFKGGLK